MRKLSFVPVTLLALAAGLSLTPAAHADFAGQPILGPLANGSSITGDTTGKADDNDGFESGTHIFDIWDGGDDVYRLDWLGGDLTVILDSLAGSDNDLFLYSPGSLDSTGDYSIVGSHDVVTILAADPGTYYINIDTTAFSEGPYQLAVVPVPSTGCLLAASALALTRRRRR